MLIVSLQVHYHSTSSLSLYEIADEFCKSGGEVLAIDEIHKFLDFKEYLQYGYFPYYFENKETYSIKLEETVNTAIESDLPIVFSIEPQNIQKLKQLVNLICTSKPQKLYLNNPNLSFTYCQSNEIGTIREQFFLNMLNQKHTLLYPKRGDFLVAEQYTFEVGGKNKSFEQIKDVPHTFVVADDIEIGFKKKIPLWLFGFLY